MITIKKNIPLFRDFEFDQFRMLISDHIRIYVSSGYVGYIRLFLIFQVSPVFIWSLTKKLKNIDVNINNNNR